MDNNGLALPTAALAPSGLSPEAGSQAKQPAANAEWPAVEWEDGYPTAEEDDFLAWDGLPLNFRPAAQFILTELPEAAANCCASCRVTDMPDREGKQVEFSTGGWSGAESLMAFIESRADARHFMVSWKRGGIWRVHGTTAHRRAKRCDFRPAMRPRLQ